MKFEHKLLLTTFRKYWHLFALTLTLSMLAAVAEVFSIALLIPFLQNLSGEGTGPISQWIGWIDRHLLGGEASRVERMYIICGVILAATWLRSIFGYSSHIFAIQARARSVADFRKKGADQLQALALRFYSKTRGGEIINSFTSEMTRLGLMLGVMLNAVKFVLLFLAYATFMVWVSWELSLLVLISFGLLSLALTRLVASVRRHGEEITYTSGQLTSTVSEFIEGVRTVVAYNRQAYERERLHNVVDDSAHARIETPKRSALIGPLSKVIISTALIVVVVLAVQFLVFTGSIGLAPLLAFLFALFRLMPSMLQINKLRGTWAQNRAGLSNVADLLRRDDKPYLPDGSREAPVLRDGLTFENVSFAYEPDEPVLEDINVHIPYGKMTALVGATGAGKSTLADLIPRFHDPTEGCILYDGIDLREFKVHSLREKIGVVSQSSHIFNDTVQANIGYGDLDASFERIVEVAEQANALDFINQMKNGFDTVLGDRGVRLSGGQRQRIAIARALLRDPEILILDEATSALDTVTEKLVQESLDRLMEGRTVIAIAHRLSTVEDADQVIVLEEGRIVEHGSYEELLDRRGKLWEYHSLQFQLA